MNLNKVFIFTDFDLDGVGSLLALHWALGARPGELLFRTTTVTNFRKEYLNWLSENNPNDFEQIYILDLDVSKNIDLIDRENVTVIDHHSTHVAAKDEYNSANAHIVNTTSASKLIYNLFKNQTTLTPERKYFIALADDYDCYEFKLKETYDLNCLFTNTQKTSTKQRTEIFLDKYFNGFRPFTVQENNIIKEHINRRNKAISELQMFHGEVSIGGSPRNVCGTSGDKFVNEICDYILKSTTVDIVFFVNVNNSHVSFRKSKQCDVDLSKLAAKLCEGGGHEYAAGGKITDAFLAFTKLLTVKV